MFMQLELLYPLLVLEQLKEKQLTSLGQKLKSILKEKLKKEKISTKELEQQAEAKAKEEIGGDIWSNGESEVRILKDFTNSDKVHVLELKNLKDGSIFSEGKTDFFKGRRNESGERISKPYKRLSIAGEPLSFKKNATGTEITNTLKNKIFGLKKKLNISDVEFKNMVDNLLGTKNSKAEYDGARLKSGMSKKEFDTQLHNRLLNDLTIKDRAASIKKDIVKLGGNEVYYLDSPLKENYPRVFKALQRIGAGMETAKFQLSKHPIGRKMASRMINTDAVLAL